MPNNFEIHPSATWPGTAKVMEEAAELIQVLAKLIATDGRTEYWDGGDLRERMVEEIGDLEAALSFFKYWSLDGRDCARIVTRRDQKLELFNEWIHDSR